MVRAEMATAEILADLLLCMFIMMRNDETSCSLRSKRVSSRIREYWCTNDQPQRITFYFYLINDEPLSECVK
jgi:hypothetical protein